jgi:hypothetical protein
MGVFDHAPPAGSGLSAVEIREDDLFWFDKGLVRGAAEATKYRDRVKAFLGF